MRKPKYLTKLEQITQLSEDERIKLKPVIEKFVFRSNDYYQSLINWNDPDDPIRKIVMPDTEELNEWGALDASEEYTYAVFQGFGHKYEDTAVILISDVCAAYCRFCFRKRLFLNDKDEVVRDIRKGIKYIGEYKQITNVLLTGGDPLIIATKKLENIIKKLHDINHVKIIRIGTKMPVFYPYRILNDPSLLEMFKHYSTNGKKIYFMVHFNHPRELTEAAVKSVTQLQSTGAMMLNQTPLIRGVNDNPHILFELFKQLSFIGVTPYYVFQCRPTLGNQIYAVPLERSFQVFENARKQCSGIAKQTRFVMSHSTGKIQVVGKTEKEVFLRYHRAANPKNIEKMMKVKSNPKAYWLDDYKRFYWLM